MKFKIPVKDHILYVVVVITLAALAYFKFDDENNIFSIGILLLGLSDRAYRLWLAREYEISNGYLYIRERNNEYKIPLNSFRRIRRHQELFKGKYSTTHYQYIIESNGNSYELSSSCKNGDGKSIIAYLTNQHSKTFNETIGLKKRNLL